MWQDVAEVIREIESRSPAELVVEIRARAASYAHADSRCGALLALVSLAVLVYMPLVVPPIAVLLDPIPFYLLGVVISRRSDALRRAFSTRNERLEAVRTRAAALFHDRRISETVEETGVLFFAALLERRIEVLADRGVLRAVPPEEWNALLAELHAERRLDPDTVIAALRKLGAMLERALPIAGVNAGANRDELPSEPEVSS